MPKIRFLETCKTREDRPKVFAAGSVHEVREDAANHWLSRNKAELVEDDDDAPRAAAPPLKPAATGGQAEGNARDGLPEGDPGARMKAGADAQPPVPPGPAVSPDGIIPPAADPEPKKGASVPPARPKPGK